jgi:hypothetical protein
MLLEYYDVYDHVTVQRHEPRDSLVSPTKLKKGSTAESRIPTTFVFSYDVTKNCIITVLRFLR